MKPIQIVLSICLLAITAHAQQTATTTEGRKVILNADGTWKYAEAPASGGVTLKLEAGLVYKTGGPQPVARTTFYLLDTFPLDELDKKGLSTEFIATCGAESPAARDIVAQRVRYEFTTGFDGRGEPAGIKPGRYWLFGAARTRRAGGCALWLTPVDLTKNQSLILDQNNAVKAR